MKYTLEDEKTPQSIYSPGIVKDEEGLLRWKFHPEHYVDDELGPAAVPIRDLKQNGLSVDRCQFSKKERIKEEITRLQEKLPDQRAQAHVYKFNCSEIRSLKDKEGFRSLLVIDEALKDNEAHAAIYSAKDRKDSKLRKIRNELLNIFKNRVDIEDIFPKAV